MPHNVLPRSPEPEPENQRFNLGWWRSVLGACAHIRVYLHVYGAGGVEGELTPLIRPRHRLTWRRREDAAPRQEEEDQLVGHALARHRQVNI